MRFLSAITTILILSLCAFAQTSDAPTALGNPTNARADLNQPDDYLVTHQGYALSYNKSRGAANWVAWHLQKSDIGTAERTNAFAPDTTLPREWWILPSDYADSGYDRGHMLPSKDRSDTEEHNRVTFLMSNMQPQVPKLNQKTWKYLEDYTREVIGKDNEAYVYAGCYGNKGRIREKVTVPTNCFKIIVVLPLGDDDLKRINAATRVIAVDMPNDESVSIRWRSYLRSVDEIERKTGFDFLSNVPQSIQKEIESKKDEQSDKRDDNENNSFIEETNTRANDNRDGNERQYLLGSRGGCYYLTASGAKKYVDKKFCETVKEPATSSENSGQDAADRNKSEDKNTKKTSPEKKVSDDGKIYLKGARGGCYYLSDSGKKIYVEKEKCSQ